MPLWARQAWLPSLIDINKKLGFAIRNDSEALDFWKPQNLHTMSGVEDKSEVDKLRSLVQGSLGLYYHQATIASIAEDSYLDQFPECLLLAGVGKKWTMAESQKRSLRTMVLKVVDFHQ